MKTELLYITDPYLKETSAKVVEVVRVSDSEFKFLLDKTIFYPMGGGQPTDQGVVVKNDSQFNIYQVLLQEGDVWHYVKTSFHLLEVGDEVILQINWDRRYKNMQVHSAGHLVDFAMHTLGFTPNKLKPLKGDHGKKPYIAYEGISDIASEALQLQVNQLIDKNLAFNWEFTDLETLEKNAIYLQPGLPKNKPLRMLSLESVGSVADGGTIVKNTSELKGTKIESILTKDNQTIINYSINMDDTKEKKVKSSNNIKLSDNFNKILEEVRSQAENLISEETLTNLWREYLGSNGKLKDLMQKIKEVAAEERKEYGMQVNELKTQIDGLINNAKNAIKNNDKSSYFEKPLAKISNKKAKVGHIHPLTETINTVNNILRRIGYSIYDGPELDTDEYVFQRANLPVDHPARDLQDTIFVEEPNILLRTQTSSVETHALEILKPPFKLAIPGRVYRNEKVNRTNHFIFHQYQLVCVQEKVSMVELFSTIQYIFKELYGDDVTIRFRNKYYPEVEPGAGVDMLCPFCKGDGCPICKHRGWIEIAGTGIIHPNMLRMAGLDTDKWQGYAFGIGLDRLSMTHHKIQDIRTLLGGNLAYKPNVR